MTQLIRRGDGGMLEVAEEGVAFLEAQMTPFDIVSVVGGFHTGKSFLLNKLLALPPDRGFEVTGRVEPTTHGIQLFTEAVVLDGESRTTFFLDTEGLAATENNHDYDAKIFAIVCIISSQLLYTSVGNINLRDLEYLELLAQRAQLFSLKSSTRTGTKNLQSGSSVASVIDARNGEVQAQSTFATTTSGQPAPPDGEVGAKTNPNLEGLEGGQVVAQRTALSFPPLTWVVNSFHMRLNNEETPKQWLDRMLSESGRLHSRTGHETGNQGFSSKDSGDDDRGGSLSTIFSEGTECQTLFLPVARAEDWQALAGIEEKDLNPEYRTGLAELRGKLAARARMKSQHLQFAQGGRWTGPELAQLLRVLVDSANKGTIGRLPSLWEMMLKDQVQGAGESAVSLHRRALSDLRALHPPSSTREFQATAESMKTQALTVFDRAVFGYRHQLVQEGREALEEKLERMAVEESYLNDQAIETLLGELKQAQSVKFATRVAALGPGPFPSISLADSLQALARETVLVFDGPQTRRYEGGAARYALQLHAQIEVEVRRREARNQDDLRALQENATTGGLAMLRERVENDMTFEARLPDGVTCSSKQDLLNAAKLHRQSARSHFQHLLGVAGEEKSAVTVRKAFEKDMDDMTQLGFLVSLAECIGNMAHAAAASIAADTERFYVTSMAPEAHPMEMEDLTRITTRKTAEARHTFESMMVGHKADFAKSVSLGEKTLASLLDQHAEWARDANDRGWQRVFRKPLHQAYLVVKATKDPPGIFGLPASPSNAFGVMTPYARQCADLAKHYVSMGAEQEHVDSNMLDRVVFSWLTDSGEMGSHLRELDRKTSRFRWAGILAAVVLLVLLGGACVSTWCGSSRRQQQGRGMASATAASSKSPFSTAGGDAKRRAAGPTSASPPHAFTLQVLATRAGMESAHQLRVYDSQTVADLKKKVAPFLGLPADGTSRGAIRLTTAKQVLTQDTATLGTLLLKNNSQVRARIVNSKS